MLIDIGEIKDKLGVLTTISSNVSSILSKVNNLGSQKTYGFSQKYTVTSSYNNTFSYGLLIIHSAENYINSIYINNSPVSFNAYDFISIPIKEEVQIRWYSGKWELFWCPLS